MPNLPPSLAGPMLTCGRLISGTAPARRGLPLAALSTLPPTSDLQAQLSMAASAKTMVDLTLLQFGLSAIGAVALVISLTYTRRALSQTARSLEHAEQTSQRQLRAYVELKHFKTIRSDEAYVFRFQIRNFGQTPACKVRMWANMGGLEGRHDRLEVPEAEERKVVELRDLQPGATNYYEAVVDDKEQVAILDAVGLSCEDCAIACARMDFEDAFGRPQTVKYSCFLQGPGLELAHANPGYLGCS